MSALRTSAHFRLRPVADLRLRARVAAYVPGAIHMTTRVVSALGIVAALAACQAYPRGYDTLLPSGAGVRAGAKIGLGGQRVGEVVKVAPLSEDPSLYVVRMRLRLSEPLEIDAVASASPEAGPFGVILTRGKQPRPHDSAVTYAIICSEQAPLSQQPQYCAAAVRRASVR
jgi:hypothetical protein